MEGGLLLNQKSNSTLVVRFTMLKNKPTILE